MFGYHNSSPAKVIEHFGCNQTLHICIENIPKSVNWIGLVFRMSLISHYLYALLTSIGILGETYSVKRDKGWYRKYYSLFKQAMCTWMCSMSCAIFSCAVRLLFIWGFCFLEDYLQFVLLTHYIIKPRCIDKWGTYAFHWIRLEQASVLLQCHQLSDPITPHKTLSCWIFPGGGFSSWKQ